MTPVYVSIGSNIEPAGHVRLAVALLRDAYGALALSSVYESEAVGFDGAAFLNLVVGFEAASPLAEVRAGLRRIEARGGRRRDGRKFDARTLDLDLLLFGDRVSEADGAHLPRAEILGHAFVLAPLAEIAGDVRHPVTGDTYAELWRRFAGERHGLRKIDFTFAERDEGALVARAGAGEAASRAR